jgi:protease-4
MYNLIRPMTPAEVAYMQLTIEDVYKRFTSIVAEGRDMSVEQVDNLGQGRVWTGAEAVEIGLVDQIGTLEDAITYAATSIEGVTGIQDVKVEAYPKPLTTMELLLESLNGSTEFFAGTPLEDIEVAFRNWNSTQSGKAYARIPYEIIIK